VRECHSVNRDACLGGGSGSAPRCTDGSDYECEYSEQRKHDREDYHRGEPPGAGSRWLVVVAEPDHGGGKVKKEAGEEAGDARNGLRRWPIELGHACFPGAAAIITP
jgi:hypothetical protein